MRKENAIEIDQATADKVMDIRQQYEDGLIPKDECLVKCANAVYEYWTENRIEPVLIAIVQQTKKEGEKHEC